MDRGPHSCCAEQVAALEALLQPGDSLIFPAKWAHHTESLDNSISVTYRLGPARPATARLAGVLRPYTACHSVVRCLACLMEHETRSILDGSLSLDDLSLPHAI